MTQARKNRPWRVLTVGLVAVAISAGLATFAYAAIPDQSGVIHSCYKSNGGDLRVIDSATSSCKGSETALDWNEQGAPGPQGPQGP